MGREAHVVIKLIIKHQADFIRCKSGQKHRFGGKELFRIILGRRQKGSLTAEKTAAETGAAAGREGISVGERRATTAAYAAEGEAKTAAAT